MSSRARETAVIANQAPDTCPCCQTAVEPVVCPLDRNARPGPGDFTACIACGIPLRFMEGGHLRRVTQADLAHLSPMESYELACLVGTINERKQGR